MSVIISDTEYKQYRAFQNNYLFNQKIESVEQIESLENDIDKPIRRIVGMLALMKFEPLFSCCGFNYAGQPMHKTHKYGTVYIQMRANPRNVKFIEEIIPHSERLGWGGWIAEDGTFGVKAYIGSAFEKKWELEHGSNFAGHPWSDKGCIHYSELANFAINTMEKVLLDNEHLFTDEVVLQDANEAMRDRFPSWQYPALKPWVIKKEDII